MRKFLLCLTLLVLGAVPAAACNYGAQQVVSYQYTQPVQVVRQVYEPVQQIVVRQRVQRVIVTPAVRVAPLLSIRVR